MVARIAAVLLWASPAGLAQAPGHISVTEFGAQPDSRANAVAAVQRALEAARRVEQSVIVFPKGRYDFWPQHAVEREYFESNTTANNPKRLAILIENFKGLTIDGGGSTFVFHDRIQPFTVDMSSGDHDPRRVDRLGHPADRRGHGRGGDRGVTSICGSTTGSSPT